MNTKTPSNESAIEEFRRRIAERRRAATPEATPFILSIPETSPERYISGIVALNIPSRAGTGDWHQTQVFFRPRSRVPGTFIVERGQRNDPSALLGNRGIEDVAPMLDSIGVPHPPGPVWAADHSRAVADLVLESVLERKKPDFVRLDDWMPTDNDKQRVVELLETTLQMLEGETRDGVNDWIEKNVGLRRLASGGQR